MKKNEIKDCDNNIPDFCWDRNMTNQQIKEKIKSSKGIEKDRLISWILREASFEEVWRFVSPEEVLESLPRIEKYLGRWRKFWIYIIGAWCELGKI